MKLFRLVIVSSDFPLQISGNKAGLLVQDLLSFEFNQEIRILVTGLFQLTLHLCQLVHQLYLIFHLSVVGSQKFLVAGFRFSLTLPCFLPKTIQLIMEFLILLIGGKKHFDQSNLIHIKVLLHRSISCLLSLPAL